MASIPRTSVSLLYFFFSFIRPAHSGALTKKKIQKLLARKLTIFCVSFLYFCDPIAVGLPFLPSCRHAGADVARERRNKCTVQQQASNPREEGGHELALRRGAGVRWDIPCRSRRLQRDRGEHDRRPLRAGDCQAVHRGALQRLQPPSVVQGTNGVYYSLYYSYGCTCTQCQSNSYTSITDQMPNLLAVPSSVHDFKN